MSPLYVILKIALIVFLIEALIMAGLTLAPPIPNAEIDALVDATILTLLSAPPIYFWVIKPYIEARNLAEKTLRLIDTVFNITDSGIMITNANREIVTINPAFSTITGYSQTDILGKTPRILSSGRHDQEFYRAMWADILSTGGWQGEIWNKRKSGELFAEWVSIKSVQDACMAITHYVAVFSDITERNRMQHLAHHDALTGLPNRTLFDDLLKQALALTKRNHRRTALMFVDLDRFKPINDELGHDVGDLLLQEVAVRLKNSIRESDVVSRVGGDEFIILLPCIEDGNNAMLVAEKIQSALARPFELAGHTLQISSSIGISIYPDQGDSEIQLIKNADIAMYHAKRNGRDNVQLYQNEMRA